MNCIIIEDDDLNRRLIEEFVNKNKSLSLIASFPSAKVAIKSKHLFNDTDILFLDVEMPEMTGFQLLKYINNHSEIIIMSSKMNYAVDAFSFEVTDFLLKPITYQRFNKAVKKAYNNIKRNSTDTFPSVTDKIYLKKNGTLHNMKFDQIAYIEAMENYSIFHTNDDKFMIHKSLSSIECKLPKSIFKRIHRSYMVNQYKIDKIEETMISISIGNSQKSLPIGKSFKEQFLNSLNSI